LRIRRLIRLNALIHLVDAAADAIAHIPHRGVDSLPGLPDQAGQLVAHQRTPPPTL
jgi:hypothetical protein